MCICKCKCVDVEADTLLESKFYIWGKKKTTHTLRCRRVTFALRTDIDLVIISMILSAQYFITATLLRRNDARRIIYRNRSVYSSLLITAGLAILSWAEN